MCRNVMVNGNQSKLLGRGARMEENERENVALIWVKTDPRPADTEAAVAGSRAGELTSVRNSGFFHLLLDWQKKRVENDFCFIGDRGREANHRKRKGFRSLGRRFASELPGFTHLHWGVISSNTLSWSPYWGLWASRCHGLTQTSRNLNIRTEFPEANRKALKLIQFSPNCHTFFLLPQLFQRVNDAILTSSHDRVACERRSFTLSMWPLPPDNHICFPKNTDSHNNAKATFRRSNQLPGNTQQEAALLFFLTRWEHFLRQRPAGRTDGNWTESRSFPAKMQNLTKYLCLVSNISVHLRWSETDLQVILQWDNGANISLILMKKF